jgi:hypothetical protein
MLTRTCRRILPLILSLGSACTDDPLVSTTSSAGPGTGSPTSFQPPPDDTGSTSAPTTGAPASTGEPATSSTTSPAEPFCGDGIVIAPEECDAGEANANTAACTLECKKAVCGDGQVWAGGGEECDFGLGNGTGYDGCHPVTCTFGPRCGDGILDPEHEICDRGPLNGTGMTPDELAPCDSVCGFYGRIIFVTSEVTTGDLGGLSGGDLTCVNAALAAGLPNATEYRAWLSDGVQSPASRFTHWDDVPLILVNGLLIAANLDELVGLGPRAGISRTEFGAPVFEWFVYTNTSAFGEIFNPTDHCEDWLSADFDLTTRVGLNAPAVEEGPGWQDWKDGRWWTTFKSLSCKTDARLYCVDDGEIVDAQD